MIQKSGKLYENLWNKHPQLFLQVIPSSQKSPQEIGIPNPQLKSEGEGTGVYSLFPKTTQQKKNTRKFRTIERDETTNAYSGNLSSFSK